VLGAEIKHYRRRLGLSSKELARLVGVNADTVELWESGELRVPRSVRLRVLLGRLEIRHREMLSSPDGLSAWKGWLDKG
jgi:transcriptional regulator with XRE-family HTH domain